MLLRSISRRVRDTVVWSGASTSLPILERWERMPFPLISRACCLIFSLDETHRQVFAWVMELLADDGLLRASGSESMRQP
jgi:hypothetical protein